MKTLFKVALPLTGAVILAGCDVPYQNLERVQVVGQYSPVILSGPASGNFTPYDPVFECFGKKLGRSRLSVAVGDVRDYTGKTTSDDGMAITQGGALMAYSALGKMEPGIQIHERFDTRIADAELAYIKNRQLGDGTKHEVPDAETGQPSEVPWMPYYGGTVLQSDYYIVGGITELNYNIRTKGAEAQVNQIGPKSREYVMNVAVDLRIVGSQSLKVYKTVSIQKQLVGYEVGFEVFRFFNSDLFDINAGEKNQEPLQLGVRMAIEEGVLQLVSAVAKIDSTACRGGNEEPVQTGKL